MYTGSDSIPQNAKKDDIFREIGGLLSRGLCRWFLSDVILQGGDIPRANLACLPSFLYMTGSSVAWNAGDGYGWGMVAILLCTEASMSMSNSIVGDPFPPLVGNYIVYTTKGESRSASRRVEVSLHTTIMDTRTDVSQLACSGISGTC